jgi:hypothetical protein
MALREAEWQGRAEGYDISKSLGDAEALRDSIKIQKKKAQRGDLPPLSDVSNNNGSSPPRGHSAPDMQSSQMMSLSAPIGGLYAAFPDEPEGIMMLAGGASASTLTAKGGAKTSVSGGASGKSKKFKKYSETENRLLNR